MLKPFTEKYLKDPSPSWLDGDIMFYMRSRNWQRRRRNFGWLLTYRPTEDSEGLGNQYPTWNVTSALIHPDGTPYRQSRNTPRQIGWIGLRPCEINSQHSAWLESRRLRSGPENNGLYQHSFTAENIAASILTAAGRALGHTGLCGPDEDVATGVAFGKTLEMHGYKSNTSHAPEGDRSVRPRPVTLCQTYELLLNESPPVRDGLYFPALRPYSEKDAYRLTVYQGADS